MSVDAAAKTSLRGVDCIVLPPCGGCIHVRAAEATALVLGHVPVVTLFNRRGRKRLRGDGKNFYPRASATERPFCFASLVACRIEPTALAKAGGLR